MKAGTARIAILRGSLAALLLAATVRPAEAPWLRLPEVFSSHMVLQRDRALPFWGTAQPGAAVTVELQGTAGRETRADAGGHWHLDLPPQAAGGPVVVTVRSGDILVRFDDVLIGEVWLCSGQSNMRFPLARDAYAAEELPQADVPELRLFDMVGTASTSAVTFDAEQLARLNRNQFYQAGQWTRCTPSKARSFSAVAYYFGHDLQRRLSVPVGLIHNAVGGANAESWISRETLAADPELHALLRDWRRNPLIHPWCRQRAARNLSSTTDPEQRYPFQPGCLFDNGIAPLIPYAIRGVIWYQGESNAPTAEHPFAYDPHFGGDLFRALITDWRGRWGQGEFPFIYVQLPGLQRPWMTFREMQLRARSVPNTGMAVTIDLGHPTDVHPRNKRDVGQRLARIARGMVYGEDVVYSGPELRGVSRDGRVLRLSFTHADGGLATHGGGPPHGFEIAGADGCYQPAVAVIDGDAVLLSSPEVTAPVAVRYAWAPVPDANLVNAAGLPASPFRNGEEAFRRHDLPPRDSRRFAHRYDAADGLPPKAQPAAGWELNDAATDGTPFTVSNAVLRYTTVAQRGARCFEQKDPRDAWPLAVKQGTSWTVELRARVLSATGGDGGLALWAGTGCRDAGYLLIRPDSLRWGATGFGRDLAGPLDNASLFHNYRIAYDADAGHFCVWRDAMLLASDLGKGIALTHNWLVVGDTGSHGSSSAELAWLRWDASGAFGWAPLLTPQPAEDDAGASDRPATEHTQPHRSSPRQRPVTTNPVLTTDKEPHRMNSDTPPPPLRGYTIPLIDLASQTRRQVIVDREPGQYLGHVTTVLLEDNHTIIAVYPKGHGRGAVVMKRSTDGGQTWSDRLPTPKSWATSQEVPVMRRVVDAAGRQRLIMFSGLYPCRMAVSEDDGLTWSELEAIGDWGGIVCMGDVIALKAPGHYLAMFHDDGRFFTSHGKRTDTMTLLSTFSEDGGLTWSFPKALFARSDIHLCEPGMVRSPDGKQIAVLMRENRRVRNSHVMFSRDEGNSWSEPRELPGAITGDRHTLKYAPDGRLVATFRDTSLESPTHGDWVAWVGTYDDIAAGRQGQYRIRLMDNHHGADCCYPGLEVLPDGTFVATTYGHWREGEQPYIVSVRFTLTEIDALAARPDRP